MKKYSHIVFWSLLAWLLLMGCGRVPPVTLDAFPVYDGAWLLVDGENSTATEAAELLRRALTEAMGGNTVIETRSYAVPAETRGEDVQFFYSERLQTAGWDMIEDWSQLDETLRSQGWSRGSDANEQVFVVIYMVTPETDETFLILTLVSE